MLKNNNEFFEDLSERQSEMLTGGITSYTILERTSRSTRSCVDEAFLSIQQAGLNAQVSDNSSSIAFARPDNNNIVVAFCSDPQDAVAIYSAGNDDFNTHRTRADDVARFFE